MATFNSTDMALAIVFSILGTAVLLALAFFLCFRCFFKPKPGGKDAPDGQRISGNGAESNFSRYVSGDAEAGLGGKVMSGNPRGPDSDTGDGIISVKKSPEHDLNFNIEQQDGGDFIITDLDASQELMDQIDQGDALKGCLIDFQNCTLANSIEILQLVSPFVSQLQVQKQNRDPHPYSPDNHEGSTNMGNFDVNRQVAIDMPNGTGDLDVGHPEAPDGDRLTKGSLEFSYQHEDANSTQEVNIDEPDAGGVPFPPSAKFESPKAELNTDTDLIIEGPAVSAALESSPNAEFGLSRGSSTDGVDVEVPTNRSFQSSRKPSEISFDAKVNASSSHSRRQSSNFASGPESRDPALSDIDLGANPTAAVAVSNPRMAGTPSHSAKLDTSTPQRKEPLEVESPAPKKKGIFSCCSPGKKSSKPPNASAKSPQLKSQSDIMETNVDVDTVVPVAPLRQEVEVVRSEVTTPELVVRSEACHVEEPELDTFAEPPRIREEASSMPNEAEPHLVVSVAKVEIRTDEDEKDDQSEKEDSGFKLKGPQVGIELDNDAEESDQEKRGFGLGFDGSGFDEDMDVKIDLQEPALEAGVDFDFPSDEADLDVDKHHGLDTDLGAERDLEIDADLGVDGDLEIDADLETDKDFEVNKSVEIETDLKPDANLDIEPESIDFDPVDESADVGVDINLDEYDSSKAQLFGTNFSKGQLKNLAGVGVSFEGHDYDSEPASKNNSFNLEGLGVENSGFNFGVSSGANEEEQKKIDLDRDARLEHKILPKFNPPKVESEQDNPKFSGISINPDDENSKTKKLDVSFTRDNNSLPKIKKPAVGFGDEGSDNSESEKDSDKKMRLNFNASPSDITAKPEKELDFGEISKESGDERGFNFGIDAAVPDTEADVEKELRLKKKKVAPGFVKPEIEADAEIKADFEPEDMFNASLDGMPETKKDNLFQFDNDGGHEGIKATGDPIKLELGLTNKRSQDGDANDDDGSASGRFNFGIDSGDGTAEDTWAILEKEARLEMKKETDPIPSLRTEQEPEAGPGFEGTGNEKPKDEEVNFGASGGIGGAIKKSLKSLFGGGDGEGSEVKRTEDNQDSNDEQMLKFDNLQEEDDVGAVKTSVLHAEVPLTLDIEPKTEGKSLKPDNKLELRAKYEPLENGPPSEETPRDRSKSDYPISPAKDDPRNGLPTSPVSHVEPVYKPEYKIIIDPVTGQKKKLRRRRKDEKEGEPRERKSRSSGDYEIKIDPTTGQKFKVRRHNKDNPQRTASHDALLGAGDSEQPEVELREKSRASKSSERFKSALDQQSSNRAEISPSTDSTPRAMLMPNGRYDLSIGQKGPQTDALDAKNDGRIGGGYDIQANHSVAMGSKKELEMIDNSLEELRAVTQSLSSVNIQPTITASTTDGFLSDSD